MIEHSSFQKLVGVTVGNYRLEQLAERGKMGPVFVATSIAQAQTKQAYMVRILDIPAEMTAEARLVYLGRFQQEANQVAALQHPSILPLVDYGNYQKMPYLVYPYSPTMKSLHDLLSQQRPLDLIMASRYLDQIATALEYAHLHAILHRNLTTNSILIETAPQGGDPQGGAPQGVINHARTALFVSDFGVMHMLEIAAAQNQGKSGNKPMGFLTFGSSEGSAPEQLLGRPVDAHTDIYALGAVLYRLLTGHRVYSGSSQDEVVQQHLHAPIPPVSARRSGVPSGVDKVIATAMAKDPLQRFHQPTMLANAYHDIVAPQDTTRPPLIVTPSPVGADLSRPSPVGAQFIAPARGANKSQPITRRRILFYIVAGGAAVAAVTTVAIVGTHFLGGSSSTAPASGSTSAPGSSNAGAVLAKTTDIPINGSKTFNIANKSNPGIIVHLTSDKFVAFDSTCTHAGCAVSYNSQDKLLECPCHGAEFDPARNAAVVRGPAQTPLASIGITVNADGTIKRSP